jgi:hypothetical protein
VRPPRRRGRDSQAPDNPEPGTKPRDNWTSGTDPAVCPEEVPPSGFPLAGPCPASWTARRVAAGVVLARGKVRRRPVPSQPHGACDDQRHADDQQHDPGNEQPQEQRPEQVGADAGLQIHGNRSGGVGVHDHHGPAAGKDVPFEFLRTGALCGCDPEILGSGAGRRPRSRHFGVIDPEGPQIQFPDFGALHSLEIARRVLLRCDANENPLARAGCRSAEQDAAGRFRRNDVRQPAADHDVQPCRGDGGGRGVEPVRLRGEVAFVALLEVEPAHPGCARQQPQSQERGDCTEDEHHHAARFHAGSLSRALRRAATPWFGIAGLGGARFHGGWFDVA